MTGCSHNREALTWEEVISDIRNKYPEVKQLQTAELQSWLTSSDNEPVILIDARSMERISDKPYSREQRIYLTRKTSENFLTDIKPDNPIVVYCSVGYRSSILAKKLQDRGFTKVYNLEGSIFKWANEGRPLVQGQTTVHKVHPYDVPVGEVYLKENIPKLKNGAGMCQ